MENYENLNFSRLNICNQKWDKMTPVKGGRLCGQCSRIVVDFTDKTNTEVGKIHLQNPDGVCGYYRPEQFKKKTESLRTKSYLSIKAILLSWVSYLSTIQVSEGKSDKLDNKYEQLDTINEKSKLDRSATKTFKNQVDTVKITGIVKVKSDSTRFEPTEGVAIHVESTNHGTTTDSQGQFTIWLTDLPDTTKKVNLIFHYIGFIRKERQVSVDKNFVQEPLEIIMDEEDYQLTDFIIIARQPLHKRIWNKIKQPFIKRKQ